MQIVPTTFTKVFHLSFAKVSHAVQWNLEQRCIVMVSLG